MRPHDTTHQFLFDWQFRHSVSVGLNGRKQSLLLMNLDKSVFAHKMFKIKDTSAFPMQGSKVNFVSVNSSTGNGRVRFKTNEMRMNLLAVTYTVTVCYSYWVPLYQGQLVGCSPGLDCPFYREETSCESISWTD